MMLRAAEEVPSHFLMDVSRGSLHRLFELLAPVTQFDTEEHAAEFVAEEAESDSHTKHPNWQEEAQVEVLTGTNDQRKRGTRQGGNERK
jgi:hypothetical protein